VVPWFPLLGLMPSGLFMGSISTLIYTSELILCFTICVLSDTRHNIHMYPYFLFGYWAEYLYALRTSDRSVMRSCPERSVQSSFLLRPPLLSDGNLYPTALLRMRGIFFAHILVSSPACAIELQHNNKNSSTTGRPWNDGLWDSGTESCLPAKSILYFSVSYVS